jgi:hypothetical protein
VIRHGVAKDEPGSGPIVTTEGDILTIGQAKHPRDATATAKGS